MRALCTSACHVELFARKIEAISVRKCVRIDMAGFGKDKKIELNWQNEIENKVTLFFFQNSYPVIVTPSATNACHFSFFKTQCISIYIQPMIWDEEYTKIANLMFPVAK